MCARSHTRHGPVSAAQCVHVHTRCCERGSDGWSTGRQPRLRLQLRAVAAERLGRGRRADAAGGHRPGRRQHLRLVAASSPGPASTTSPPWTASSRCCTPTASGSTWAPAPPRRRPGSPPGTRRSCPWLADGTTRLPGGRQAWCPSSPVFRERALALVEQVAIRYGEHPAVALWHVSNELGCHNALCYDEASAAAFRRWLTRRYGSIDALNKAWGTTFWSQRYEDWAEIQPPRLALSLRNPGQLVDFQRFSSDELLEHYRAEAGVLRRHTRRAGHHQLHGHRAHPRAGLLELGAGDGRRRQRPLPRPPPRRPGRGTRPSPPTSPAGWPAAGRGC